MLGIKSRTTVTPAKPQGHKFRLLATNWWPVKVHEESQSIQLYKESQKLRDELGKGHNLCGFLNQLSPWAKSAGKRSRGRESGHNLSWCQNEDDNRMAHWPRNFSYLPSTGFSFIIILFSSPDPCSFIPQSIYSS